MCLHLPFVADTTEPLPFAEELFKRMAIQISGPFLQVVFTMYLSEKAKRFMKKHCPHKKMSSIGRYKRNLMSHVETSMMAIIWNLLGIWETFVHFQLRIFNISPDTAFKVDTMLWLILGEGTIFLLTVVLSLRDIPTYEETPRRTKFYVHIPGDLEPRRPPSLHEEITGPQTVCLGKNIHNKVTKLPPITSVTEFQSSDEMKRADEISSCEVATKLPPNKTSVREFQSSDKMKRDDGISS